MKFVSVLVVALAVMAAVSEARRHFYFHMMMDEDAQQANDDDFKYFDQRNDHFDKDNITTYKQRYIVNDTLWGGNGYPIFVMLGGEGPLSASELKGYFILNEKAAVYKALMVSVEHRFYGLSIPGDGTLSTENLELLSADQALADYAVFIEFIKTSYNATDSKVVTFGGSYSGSLSAWMRQKYPNLVDIAYASSAPVQAQLDFPEYHKVVTASIGETCAARINEAMKTIESLMVSNMSKIMEDFIPCSEMQTDLDQVTFLEALSDGIAGVVQYSGDNNAIGRYYTISKMCDMIGTGDAYDSFANYTRSYFKVMGDGCVPSNYTDVIEDLKNTDPKNPDAAGRSWTYQTCVEYGYYQTVESSDVPFSQRITLDFFLSMCNDAFGINKSNPAICVDYTNDYYGGRDVRSDKIVFLNGSVDPWHALGLVSDTPKPNDMPVCYINGTAHCADLYSSSPDDLDSLTEARKKAWEFMDAWIKDENPSSVIPPSSSTPSSDGVIPFIHSCVLGLFMFIMAFIPRM